MATSPSSISDSSSIIPLQEPFLEEQRSNILARLPEELLSNFFKWFNWKELAICRLVCVRFRANIDCFSSFELERIKHIVKSIEKSSTDSEALNSCKSNVIGMVEEPEEAIVLLKTLSDEYWFFQSLLSIVERFAPKSQLDTEALLDLFFEKKALISHFEMDLERFLKEIFPYIDFAKSLKILEKIKAHRELAKNFVFKIIEQKISFAELEKLVKALDPNDPNRDQNIKEVIKREKLTLSN